MARTVVTKTSFLGGEAGPLLEGRSDLAQFQLGARRLNNFIALKGGAITRRPGTRYVCNTLADKPARLIPFIFSYSSSSDIYMVEITLASSTTLEFRVISIKDHSIVIPTTHTLTVDANLINLDEIQFTQSADLLFLVQAGFEPQILQRTALTPVFNLTPYIGVADSSRSKYKSLPYLDENVSATTLSINTETVGTGRVITFSTPTLTGTSADVGKWFAQLNGTLGTCFVTAAISITQATVTVVDAWAASASAHTEWWEGAWSPEKGWPRTICFYNQRLMFGGNTKKPDTFWASKVGNYLQMSNINAAFAINDPLNFQLASQGLNQIKWMIGGKKHTIGTAKSEWVGTITNDGTNLFVQYDEETTHGSAAVQPARFAYTIPFVQRSGQTLREMIFDFYSDNYTTTDLNLFSSQVGAVSKNYDSNAFDVYIKALVIQESPSNIIWTLDTVGRLFGITRDKQQQIAAWHSHSLGGVFEGSVEYPGWVQSIAVVPSANGRSDRLWMVVKRTINSQDRYHVEYMDDIKSNSTLVQGYTITVNGDVADIRTFLDCATRAETGLTDTDPHNTVSWSGLTRFASDNAYIVATRSNHVVFAGVLAVDGSGNITLPVKAQAIVAGLHANAEMRLLPIEGGDAPKINSRSLKRIDLATVKLFETYGLRVGKDRVMGSGGYADNNTFEPIYFLPIGQVDYNTFTGSKEFQVPESAEIDASFALVMQEPWPCTILAVSSRVVMNEI